MSRLTRVVASAALTALTIGTLGAVVLVGTASEAVAKSEKSGGKGKSKGASASKARAKQAPNLKNLNAMCANGNALGRANANSNVGRINLYNTAVGAVQSAEDAVVRAAALLAPHEIPPANVSSAGLQNEINILEALASPSAVQLKRLDLLRRQLPYRLAVEDLLLKKSVENQALLYASKGREISADALKILRAGC